MKQLYRLIFLLALTPFAFTQVSGQYLSFNNQVPQSLSVCENEDGFRIRFRNNFGGQIRNIYVKVQFPNGVEYNGNLSNNSNWSANEYNLNDLSTPWFRIQQLPKNKTASFNFDGIAMPAALNGNSFFNQITVYFQTNNSWWFYYVQTNTSTYEIRSAQLDVITVSPMNNTVAVNQLFTRSIVVENSGDGRVSSFDIRDIHSTDLDLESVNIGSINGAGNSITISGADFLNLGNEDAYFDPGESITINESIRAIGCGSPQSELFTQYGCDNQQIDGNSVFATTTITAPLPVLSVTPQPSFNTCVDGSSDEQRLVIKK